MRNDAITPASARIDVVDALRGFALFGILIVHFLEQFYTGPLPPGRDHYTVQYPADQILDSAAAVLLRGKFFMIFAFLFGSSFYLQMHRRNNESDLSTRFAWRMALLFAIGFVHNLFYRGDILTVYAVLGLPLILFHKRSNPWLLVTAGALMLGLPRLVIKGFELGQVYHTQVALTQTTETVYWAVAKSGSWFELARQNTLQGFPVKIAFQFGAVGRGYQTFAMFLLGVYAGRIQLFEELQAKGTLLKKGLLWSWLIFCMTLLPVSGWIAASPKWINVVEMTSTDLGNMALAAVYVFIFLLLVRRDWWRRQLFKLAPFGRMALTNYIGQSLIGTAVAFGYGFGLLGEVGSIFMLSLGVAVFLLQRLGSDWWLRHYYYGPVEWCWRSATLWKWQKFRR